MRSATGDDPAHCHSDKRSEEKSAPPGHGFPARARDDYQQTCHSDERSEEKSAPTGYGFLARGGGLGMTAGAYSADSHIVEPQELFAGLERRYGERAPLIVPYPAWRY